MPVHGYCTQWRLRDTGGISCKHLPCAPSAVISGPRLNPTLANHDKVTNNCSLLHLSFFMIFLSFLPSFSLVFLALTLRSLSCSLFPVRFSIDKSGTPSYWLHVFLSSLPFLKWSSPSILKYFWGKKQCLYHFTTWANLTSHYSSHPASSQGYTHLLPQ